MKYSSGTAGSKLFSMTYLVELPLLLYLPDKQSAGENKRMHDLGYHKLCDCGTKTWVYTKYCN